MNERDDRRPGVSAGVCSMKSTLCGASVIWFRDMLYCPMSNEDMNERDDRRPGVSACMVWLIRQ